MSEATSTKIVKAACLIDLEVLNRRKLAPLVAANVRGLFSVHGKTVSMAQCIKNIVAGHFRTVCSA